MDLNLVLFLLSMIGELFKFAWVFVKNNNNRKELSDLRKLSKRQKEQLITGTFRIIFKEEKLNNVDIFYSRVSIRNVDENNQHPNKKIYSYKKLIDGPFLLTAEAGYGKSTIMKEVFKRTRIRYLSSLVYYFDSESLVSFFTKQSVKNTFVKNISIVKPDHLIIFLDGLDELPDYFGINGSNRKNIISFFDELKEYVPILDIRASCRTKFANDNNIYKLLFDDRRGKPAAKYEICNWLTCKDSLYGFYKKIVKNREYRKAVLNSNTYERLEERRLNNNYFDLKQNFKIKKNEILSKDYISSPILLVMFLKIVSEKGFKSIINGGVFQKYYLIDAFVKVLFGEKIEKYHDDYHKFLNVLFVRYKTNKKLTVGDLSEKNKETFLPIIKTDFNKALKTDGVIFTHKIFTYYFVAAYYLEILDKNIDDIVNSLYVFSASYSNDVSDLINSAIKNKDNDSKNSIATFLIVLYQYTTIGIFDSVQNYNPSIAKGFRDKINYNDLIRIKNEIIARLGRMYVEDDKDKKAIATFLEYVYYNEDDIRYKGWEQYSKDIDYFLICLKRTIALSNAYVGNYKCELDYLSKSIDDTISNNHYDLANRSQTLIYYNDVSKDYLLWRDDDCKEPHIKTYMKIWEHLSINGNFGSPKIEDKPEFFKEAERKSIFRPFDLVVLYSILKSRNIKHLNKEEYKIMEKLNFSYFRYDDDIFEFLNNLKKTILEKFHY